MDISDTVMQAGALASAESLDFLSSTEALGAVTRAVWW